MKTIKQILENIKIIKLIGNDNLEINELVLDSRKPSTNSMFFAVVGTVSDAHQFIPQAINNGSIAIVCSQLPENLFPKITYILVENVQQVVGFVSHKFLDSPSEKLKLIGITGTNGKTSTTTMLFDLVTSLGYKCGLISTVEYRIGDKIYPSTHTTPDAIRLNNLLKQMVDEKVEYCFMEVSSHAIDQGRINGLEFTGAAFTNITHDHLDYHHTFDNYIKAKKKFFDQLPIDAFALTNKDDKNGLVMLQNTKSSKFTYSLHHISDFKCKIIETDFTGLNLQIDGYEAWFPVVGEFNAYNLLCVYSIAFLLHFNKEEVIVNLSKISGVRGRFEVVRSQNKVTAIIDYAHTPDALENVLKTIDQIRTGNEQLITVMGCGGNRDKAKRPLMAQIALKYSNKVILTSDNPRDENPDDIIEEMMTGVDASNYKKVIKMVDRYEAIKLAVVFSKPNDIILISGKGHETYQEIKGTKHPFNDKEITINLFKEILI